MIFDQVYLRVNKFHRVYFGMDGKRELTLPDFNNTRGFRFNHQRSDGLELPERGYDVTTPFLRACTSFMCFCYYIVQQVHEFKKNCLLVLTLSSEDTYYGLKDVCLLLHILIIL